MGACPISCLGIARNVPISSPTIPARTDGSASDAHVRGDGSSPASMDGGKSVPTETPQEQADLGKRAAEAMNMHLFIDPVNAPGRWVAIRMSDGGSDGVLYDTRPDAIAHQLHEQYCCYFQLPREGVTPDDARRFIEINRQLYDNGARLTDPDMPGDPIFPDDLESYITRGIR